MNNWVDFQSGCGVCKASSDYAKYYGMGGTTKRRGRPKKRRGGGMGQYENVVGSKTMIPMGVSENSANDLYPTQLLSRDNNSKFMNNNLGIDWATTGGAKKNNKKNNKKKDQAMQRRLKTLKNLVNKIREGSKNKHHNGKNHNGHHNGKNHNGHHNKNKLNAQKKKSTRNTMKVNKKTKKNGTTRNQSGGDTNWGATGMPQRFYDVNDESMNYGLDSGMGVQTAYGKSVPLDAGVGNLAPFNTSRASAPLSMMQTGGMSSLNQDVYDQSQIDIDYNKLAGQPISKSQNGGRRRRKHKGGTFYFSDEPVKSSVASVQSSVDGIVSKFNELNASMASFDETLSSMLSGGSKKSKTRKCPKSIAKEHKLGKKMRGSDGNVWKVTQDKNKRKRWTKVNKKKKVVRKGASKKKRH